VEKPWFSRKMIYKQWFFHIYDNLPSDNIQIIRVDIYRTGVGHNMVYAPLQTTANTFLELFVPNGGCPNIVRLTPLVLQLWQT
jgi:hypothetical protein